VRAVGRGAHSVIQGAEAAGRQAQLAAGARRLAQPCVAGRRRGCAVTSRVHVLRHAPAHREWARGVTRRARGVRDERLWGDATSSRGDASSSRGDAKSSRGDAESSLGDAESSRGDAESSLRDAESSLGDAKSSLRDAESSLGDVQVIAWDLSSGLIVASTKRPGFYVSTGSQRPHHTMQRINDTQLLLEDDSIQVRPPP
jgi:multidrug resistance efflux pump